MDNMGNKCDEKKKDNDRSSKSSYEVVNKFKSVSF